MHSGAAAYLSPAHCAPSVHGSCSICSHLSCRCESHGCWDTTPPLKQKNHYHSEGKSWEVHYWWLLTEEVGNSGEQLSVLWEKAEQNNVHAQELPADTNYHHCDLPELSEQNSEHVLVSRWVRSLVRGSEASWCFFFFFFFFKVVWCQDSTAKCYFAHFLLKSLSERPSRWQETGNTFSHLGANHKLRLFHHLFSGSESEMFRDGRVAAQMLGWLRTQTYECDLYSRHGS